MSYHSNSPNLDGVYKYRDYIVDLKMPDEDKDILIDIVRVILAHFVDQAFQVQTDQITLQSVGRAAVDPPCGHATIEHNPETQTADAQHDGVESDFNQLGSSEL